MSTDPMTHQSSSSNVVNLGSPAHQHAQDLLPWFVMNTLDPAERAAVEEHLRDCSACQQEVQWQQQLREANRVPLPERDVDRAFAALRARMPVAPCEAGRMPQPSRAKALPGSSRLHGLRTWWQSISAPTGWALAVQAVLILGLSGAVLFGVDRAGSTVGSDASLFHALGRPVASVPAARLVIAFAPQTSVAEMRRVLLASGARIVDGPTAADAYILAVAPEHAEQALQSLRAEHSVLLVQSLEAKETH